MVRRHSTGYVYIDGRPVWRPSPNAVIAEIIAGMYGEELDYLGDQLDDLVKAVQRECAAKIKADRRENRIGTGYQPGMMMAADLIDPDK